jgi:hypothetical protein
MYLAVAYLPLTVFLLLVVAFHISVASPDLNAAVLLCQIYASSPVLRVLVQNSYNTKYFSFVQFLATVYGIWNLDFFRTVIPPICLPLSMMQVMALDYLVAVYPLLVLAIFYVLVRAHDRRCRLVVRHVRPCFWCSARLRHQWNMKHSIIDAFATFLLLSYFKLVNTSGDLLIPTKVHDIHGFLVGYFMHGSSTCALCHTCYGSACSCSPVSALSSALSNEVVPNVPQRVSPEQPSSENLHGLPPRLLS